MIMYNFRYRGPYEYDKFILNTFQFHNEVVDMINNLNSSDANKSIKSYSKAIDDLIEKLELVELQLSYERERLK